jgi:hypothetical protein
MQAQADAGVQHQRPHERRITLLIGILDYVVEVSHGLV